MGKSYHYYPIGLGDRYKVSHIDKSGNRNYAEHVYVNDTKVWSEHTSPTRKADMCLNIPGFYYFAYPHNGKAYGRDKGYSKIVHDYRNNQWWYSHTHDNAWRANSHWTGGAGLSHDSGAHSICNSRNNDYMNSSSAILHNLAIFAGLSNLRSYGHAPGAANSTGRFVISFWLYHAPHTSYNDWFELSSNDNLSRRGHIDKHATRKWGIMLNSWNGKKDLSLAVYYGNDAFGWGAAAYRAYFNLGSLATNQWTYVEMHIEGSKIHMKTTAKQSGSHGSHMDFRYYNLSNYMKAKQPSGTKTYWTKNVHTWSSSRHMHIMTNRNGIRVNQLRVYNYNAWSDFKTSNAAFVQAAHASHRRNQVGDLNSSVPYPIGPGVDMVDPSMYENQDTIVDANGNAVSGYDADFGVPPLEAISEPTVADTIDVSQVSGINDTYDYLREINTENNNEPMYSKEELSALDRPVQEILDESERIENLQEGEITE